MTEYALNRVYTDEKNNQMLNAIIDFVTDMKNKMVQYYEIKKLEKNLDNTFTNIDNTLDLFIAYIREISQNTVTEQYIDDIIKNDDKFYGFIQNLYLYSCDAYEIVIKLGNKNHKYSQEDMINYKSALNFTVIFLGGVIDGLNEIKFKNIVDGVA